MRRDSKNKKKDNSKDILGKRMKNVLNVISILLIGNNFIPLNILVTEDVWSLHN